MARALVDSAAKRLAFFKGPDIDQDNAPIIFEGFYEAIRECGQALMASRYKAENSHEAVIAFLNDHYERDFGKKLINDFDRFGLCVMTACTVSVISAREAKKALIAATDFMRSTPVRLCCTCYSGFFRCSAVRAALAPREHDHRLRLRSGFASLGCAVVRFAASAKRHAFGSVHCPAASAPLAR